MKAIASHAIGKSIELFANGVIDEKELEADVELYTKVDECEFCDGTQLCSTHYEAAVHGSPA